MLRSHVINPDGAGDFACQQIACRGCRQDNRLSVAGSDTWAAVIWRSSHVRVSGRSLIAACCSCLPCQQPIDVICTAEKVRGETRQQQFEAF